MIESIINFMKGKSYGHYNHRALSFVFIGWRRLGLFPLAPVNHSITSFPRYGSCPVSFLDGMGMKFPALMSRDPSWDADH